MYKKILEEIKVRVKIAYIQTMKQKVMNFPYKGNRDLKIIKMIFIAFLAVLLIIPINNCTNQDNAKIRAEKYESLTQLVMKPYFETLRTIDVIIGNDTLPFILDTGGGVTIITPEVAQSLGYYLYGRITAYRCDGSRIDIKRCEKINLNFGPVKVSVDGAVFDIMSLFKSDDVPVVGGLISLHTFQDIPFTLDLANNIIILESRESFGLRIKDMKELSVRTSRQAGGAAIDLFIELQTEQGTIWMELDAGNTGPVILSPHSKLQMGIDQNQETGKTNFDFIGFGEMELDFRTVDLIYDGLLNSNFLEKIIITIDLKSEKAWAKKK
ncbi:MAG: hypothetical protein WBC02_09405 [Candidatus Aminicenantaceae bacterium]